MKPEDLWVVYNRLSATILFVYTEEIMARRKMKKVHETAITGSTPNEEKIVTVSMDEALILINRYHIT